MSIRLEDRLNEIEKVTPIKSDRELSSVLRHIIEEESNRISENNVELISEASELLLSIEGVREEEVEVNSKRLFTDFMVKNESRPSVETRRKGKLVYGFTSLRKVAVFAVLIVSAAVILASFNGEVRAAMKNTFVTWMRELAIIDFTKEESTETERETTFAVITDISSIKLENIPEEFTLKSSKTDGESKLYTYENGDDFIVVELIPTDPSGIIHSTEDHKYSEIAIGNTLGYLFYNEDKRSGSIIFGNSKVTVIVGGVADREVLIEFAKGIEQ